MYHNAFENLKLKIRVAETTAVKEDGCFFSQICQEKGQSKDKRRKETKEVVDIRQYFTQVAIRDNIMAYTIMQYLSDKEVALVVCSSKSAFDCNVSVEEASLNLDLLSGKALKDCKKYVAGISNEMMDQFEPWYFGVAFAFCFKYCTGMPDLRFFDQVKRHRRHDDAPLVDLQLWSKIITRRCEKALSSSWDLGFSISNLLFRSKMNMSRSLFAFEAESRTHGG